MAKRASKSATKQISNKAPPPGLVIDNSDLSWGDSKAGMIVQAKIRKAQVEFDAALMVEAMGEAEALLAKVVKAVPRDWLISTAPEVVDWADPNSFNLLKGDKFGELFNAYGESSEPENAAKN